MIYFVCFSLSLLFLGIRVKGRVQKVFVIIGILIPCVLAAMRGMSVGSDTSGYPFSLFSIATENSFLPYLKSSFLHGWNYDYVYSMGIGYATFVYVITKLFGTYAAVLFFTQLIINGCVYKALSIMYDKKQCLFGMAMFYLIFYNITLNLIRQWMALAFLILGFSLLFKNNKKWIICALVGVSFHATGLFGLVVYVLYYTINNYGSIKSRVKNNKRRSLLVFALSVVGLAVILNLSFFASFLSSIGFSSFGHYFSGKIQFSAGRFILALPLLLLIIINWKRLNKDNNRYFFLTFAILNIFVEQINTMNTYAWRIGVYFSSYSVFAYPYLLTNITGNRRKLQRILMLAYGLIYWIYYFYYLNLHRTLPYVTSM